VSYVKPFTSSLAAMKEEATALAGMSWRKLACTRAQLRLDIVLRCGQSFRWAVNGDRAREWVGPLAGRLWVLSQDDRHLMYKSNRPSDDHEAALSDNF